MSASTNLRPSTRLAATLSAAAVATAGLLGAIAPSASALPTRSAATPTFTTIVNPADPTFNQLLGINNAGVISGYYGSGMPGHPNRGYTIAPPYSGNFTNVDFPSSVQTQVTSLNNKGDEAGFFSGTSAANHAFIEWNGVFTHYHDPDAFFGSQDVEQVLGLNDAGAAVGFYTNASGTHPFELDQATGKFTNLKVPGTGAQATAIDDVGDIAGFSTANGSTFGWLIHAGHLSELSYPGSTLTQIFGVNVHQELVGIYTDSSGTQHGFTVTSPLTRAHWTTIDDPNAQPGSTFVNGVNNAGSIVGFFTDAASDVDGFLAN